MTRLLAIYTAPMLIFKVAGNLFRRFSFDRRLPECLPGRFLDFAADLPGGPVQASSLVFLFPQRLFVVRLRLLLDQLLDARIAGTGRMTLAAGHGIPQLIAGDGEQPTAETAAVRVVLELPDSACHGAKDLLRQIGGIRVLQAMLAAESIDQAVRKCRQTRSRPASPASRESEITGLDESKPNRSPRNAPRSRRHTTPLQGNSFRGNGSKPALQRIREVITCRPEDTP